MGYMVAVVETRCGFEAVSRTLCPNCQVDNTWQKLDEMSFRCTRCQCRMSIHESMLHRMVYKESEQEIKELEEVSK